jgi:hypothetical protein
MDKMSKTSELSIAPLSAPEHEIEITPAMIEAGAIALADFDLDYESYEDGAKDIFTEMMAVGSRNQKGG